MNLSLFNKIATVGLVAIVVGTIVNIIATIVAKSNSVSALPTSYKVIVVACCWGAIALVGFVIYLVIKKHIKA